MGANRFSAARVRTGHLKGQGNNGCLDRPSPSSEHRGGKPQPSPPPTLRPPQPSGSTMDQ